MALGALNLPTDGWTVIMDDAGAVTEANGLDYVLDLVSELELCPAFPVARSGLLKVGTRHHSPAEIDHHKAAPARPQVLIF